MGFPSDISKKAIKETGKCTLDDVLDKVIALAEEEAKKKSKEKPVEVPAAVKYKSYACTVCTFTNFENPGPVCSVCTAKAPDSAIV